MDTGRGPRPMLPEAALRFPIRALVVLLLLSTLAMSACSPKMAGPPPRKGAELVGTASWYGPKYHGRTTASGERYDMEALTAAHRTLPFGTRVRVTNLVNGRKIVLKVNDRGPFIAGRVIDVSRRAARELDFLEAGLAEVRIEVLGS